MARSILNRLYGRVYGWFDSKDARTYYRPAPAKFGTRARLALNNLEDRIVPATIMVTSLDDSGPGTLRQAILDANADTLDDVITFDPSLFIGGAKTISLKTALPAFTGTTTTAFPVSVKLIGPGEDLLTVRRDANASTSFGIISFSNGVVSQNTVEISKITFSGGTTGNAVTLGNEFVTMDRVVVSDNAILTSTAIIISAVSGVPGTLTMTNSRVTGNLSTVQGGLYVGAGATLTLQNSVISGNTGVGPGGGIRLATGANLFVTDSVISNNRASSNGGGIYFFNGGSLNLERSTVSGNVSIEQTGGVYFYGAIGGSGFKIQNSTIANNVSRRAGGGVGFYNHGGTAQIFNSTITGNTSRDFSAVGAGGVSVMSGTGTVDIQSSIVSGNFATNLPLAQSDLRQGTGIITADFSAIGVDPGFGLTGTNNIPFGSFLDLGPLVENVPGKTPTFAIGAASAALDKGSTAISGTFEDQNGTARPDGVAPDIGAFERIQADPDASYSGTTTISVPTPGPDFFFEVTYNNNTDNINASTIGNDDIRIVRISGPAGFTPVNVLAKFVEFVPPGPPVDGKPITAKYSFTIPGGSWDAADNGVYRFVVEPNSVKSVSGKSSPNVAIADLTVGIAQTFVVTSLADSGPGTLREAFSNVNIVLSNDTITFDPALFTGGSQFINLVSPLPVISDHVTITGPGSGLLTIRRELGSPVNFGIFSFVNGAIQTKVNVSGLTLTRGQVAFDGAGLFAGDEDVTLTDMVITGNSGRLGGGIMTLNGKLTIIDSTISNNTASSTGGALFNGQTELVIRNSTISGNTNQAANRGGGGIMLFGNLPPAGVNIINSTISGNTANFSGGGVEVFYSSGTININNSTITGNQANNVTAGAGKFGGGIAIELASNVVGGVTVNLNGTIVSGNKLGSPTAPPETADIASVGTNVTLNISKSAIGVNPLVTFASPNGANLPFGSDLKLGALAGNGGLTKTHALSTGSPAIDAGIDVNVPTLAFDQRGVGFPRNKFGGVDIGAYEFQGDVPSVTPGVFADVTVDSPATNPYVFEVTYKSSPSLVQFSTINQNDEILVTGPGGFSQLATFVSSVPAADANSITAKYKITPPGGTWNGDDNGTYTVSIVAGQVFNTAGNSIPAGAIGTFNAVLPITRVVTNNNDFGPGSLRQAILDTNANPAADFIVFDTSGGFFDGSPAKSVITAALGPMQILDNVTITGPGAKFATVSGGNTNRVFIVNGPGQLSVNISKLTVANGNVTDGSDGGAFAVADEKLTLDSVIVENNQTNGGGGAILINAGGVLAIQNSEIRNNKATGDDGGAIIAGGNARVAITNSTLSGNTAEDDGGAIYFLSGGSFLLDRSTISGNVAKGNGDGKGGGGIYFYGVVNTDDFIIVNSTISGNSALFSVGAGVGGGISLVETVTVAGTNDLIIRNSTITENFGTNGGGGIALQGTNSTNIDIISSIVSGNLSSFSPGTSDDVFNLTLATVNYSFSAIGQDPGFGITDQGNNLPFGADLKLGPLAFNLGGTTKTHLPGATSPVLNVGTNPAPAQAFDQNGNSRSFGAGVDIGSVEVQPVIPSVTDFTVNNGAVQRSRLTSITLTFSNTVTVGQFNALGNITLTRTLATPSGTVGTVVQTGATGANGLITVTQPGPTNQLVLTFSNANGANETAGVEFGSLSDGRWQLAVNPANFLSTLNDPALRRLFGDFEVGPPPISNGTVDSSDFGSFGGAFGTSPGVGVSPFDYDNNGTIDSTDFAAFGSRFGLST